MLSNHTPHSLPGGGYRCSVCHQTARTIKAFRAIPCGGTGLLNRLTAEAEERVNDPLGLSDDELALLDDDE